MGLENVAALTSDKIKRWHRELAKCPPRVRTKRGAAQRYREVDQSDDAVRARQASANRILTILKAALNHAWREKRDSVPDDSGWRGVKPFSSVDVARVRYLSIADAGRLVKAAVPEVRPLVQAALLTGARYGQLVRLDVSDFNAQVGTIQLVSHKGKHGVKKVYHATLTTEGTAFFMLACAGKVPGELIFPNRGRNQRASERKSGRSGAKGDLAALKHERDDEMWHDSEQSRPMVEACRRAKITPAISFHGLRHTWASLAVMNGMYHFW